MEEGESWDSRDKRGRIFECGRERDIRFMRESQIEGLCGGPGCMCSSRCCPSRAARGMVWLSFIWLGLTLINLGIFPRRKPQGTSGYGIEVWSRGRSWKLKMVVRWIGYRRSALTNAAAISHRKHCADWDGDIFATLIIKNGPGG